MDLVFLVDGTYTVGIATFNVIMAQIKDLVNEYEIGPDDVQVAVAVYGRELHDQFQLNDHLTKTELFAAIDGLSYPAGLTNTGNVLTETATTKFTPSAGRRENVPAITVLFADGTSSDLDGPAASLQAVSTVIALGFGGALVDTDVIATGPEYANRVYDASELSALFNFTADLLCEIGRTYCEGTHDHKTLDCYKALWEKSNCTEDGYSFPDNLTATEIANLDAMRTE
ncbi:unnamed protein product [Clavelina lepadiformis]|uniref:VWFA domain-containing protein n=1 Tax=Clavelina lepadiformis TaxID=159417 RepID=A0ABP0GRT4_CLALP